MKKIFKLLAVITFCVSMLIPLSSCNFFTSNNSTSSNSIQNSESFNEPPLEESNYEYPRLLDYKVTDLEKYNHPDYHYKKEYILNHPKDYFTLEITLNNKDKLPITGVLINQTKYEGSAIKCSSNNSKIEVKMQSNEDYGVQVYDMTKIFFTANNKDIYFGLANRKFVLRVKQNHVVEASNFTFSSTTTSLNLSFTISDPDNVAKTLPFNYNLIDKDLENEEIVKNGPINVGENYFLFDDLKEFTNYELQLYYGRHLYGDGGTEIFIDIARYNLQTRRAIEINNIVADYEKVNFQIDNKENVTINEMYLKNLSKNTEEKHTTMIVNEFNDISTDTDYAIAVKFSFKNREYVREFNFKTKAYVSPTFSFKSYNVKYQTISYEVEFNDPLNLGTFIKVTLEGPRPQTLNTLKGTFENCLNGTYYKLVISYSYNLRDGNGSIYKKVTEEVKTQTVNHSDINLDLTLNGPNSIDYALNCNSRDDVTLTSIELSANNEVKETITNKELNGTFANLINNQNYVVKANYEITLEGETSKYVNTITQTIKTRKLQTPTFNLEITPGRRDVNYKLVKSDPDNVFTFFDVLLYKNQEYIAQSNNSKGQFANLLSGHKYKLKMSYQLNYNDNNYPRPITQEYEFTTDTLSAPIFSVSKVNIGPDYFSCDVNLEDPTNSIKPDSIYTVVSDINVNHQDSYNIEDYHHIVLTNLYSCSTHVLSIRYEYDLNDGEGTRYKTFNYKFRTLEQIVVTSFTITKNNYSDPELRNFDINIVFKNPDHLNFDRIVINGVTLDLTYIPKTEIKLNVGDIFNYSNMHGENTLDAFITTTNTKYDVYIKYY